MSKAGYEWIELGPYGYLPADPGQLRDELGIRNLTLSAGTCFTGFHRGDVWAETWEHVKQVAELTSALGAKHIVVIPDMWRDPATGEQLEQRSLGAEVWTALGKGTDRLAKALHEEYGVQLQFHPHADSHVDTQEHVGRFLEITDPDLVTLCLDTGHIAYCGGDNLALIEKHPSRIGYLHLKQVDPAGGARPNRHPDDRRTRLRHKRNPGRSSGHPRGVAGPDTPRPNQGIMVRPPGPAGWG